MRRKCVIYCQDGPREGVSGPLFQQHPSRNFKDVTSASKLVSIYLHFIMEEDDDDDIYAPDDNIVTGQSCHAGNGDSAETATKKDADGNEDDGEEEGEEIEEDESDSVGAVYSPGISIHLTTGLRTLI